MPLTELHDAPNEVLYEIAGYLDPADLNSFLRCNRHLALLLGPCLHKIALSPKNGHSALFEAAMRFKYKLVEYILKSQVDADINMEGLLMDFLVFKPYKFDLVVVGYTTSLLYYAVRDHHFGTIKTFVEKGARIPTQQELERVGMIEIRDEQLLEYLLDSGFPMPEYALLSIIHWDIGPFDKRYPECSPDWILGNSHKLFEFCALLFSSLLNMANFYSIYLEKGADIEQKRPCGDDDTPLNYAAYLRRDKIVTVLLDHGADVNIVNKRGYTPLLLAVMNRYDDRRHLYNYYNPLYLDSCERERFRVERSTWEDLEAVYPERGESIVMQLLDYGANINARASDGKTALHIAAISSGKDGNAGLLEILLQNGTDIAAIDSEGATALHYAAGSACTEAVSILLANGADISVQTKTGDTPPICAAREKHLSTVREKHLLTIALLLDRGANILTCNYNGQTPLHYSVMGYCFSVAAECNILYDESIVVYLLENGADLDFKDSEGRTPLDLGRINETYRVVNQTGIVKLLLEWEKRTEGLF